MPVKKHSELIVWQKAMDWVEAVYRATENFPSVERFGLARQLRESAVSVPSNISEGFGQLTTAAYLRYLGIARGSLYEAETQTEIAARLRYLSSTDVSDLTAKSAEVGRFLNNLLRSLHDLPNPRVSSTKTHSTT
jgi:four helix bundle protein